jgi:hypothetical protein
MKALKQIAAEKKFRKPNLLRKLLILFFLVILPIHNKAEAQKKIFKISVLSSGTVLLDEKPIKLSDLAEALQGAKTGGAAVWYYRESPATEPPPQAKEVLDLVIKSHLSISFSTKPDFSDYVDDKGISRPRISEAAHQTLFEPRMPKAKAVPDIEKIFADARRAAGGNPRRLIVVRPDRTFGAFSVQQPSKSAAEKMERVVSSSVKRNIAVIGYTGFDEETFASTSARDANQAIPFFGLLIGLSGIGHSVWIFEGQSNAIAAGCRDADLLIVDSGMLPFLPKGWEDEAAKVMRNPNIMVHDRPTYRLQIVRKVGEDDRLQFRN